MTAGPSQNNRPTSNKKSLCTAESRHTQADICNHPGALLRRDVSSSRLAKYQTA